MATTKTIQVISVCVQTHKYNSSKMIHFTLGTLYSNCVGWKSIDISLNLDKDRLIIESPIYRGSTTDNDLKFFCKVFPVLRDLALECTTLPEFMLKLGKIRGYSFEYFTYSKLPNGDPLFRSNLDVNDLVLELL